MHIANAEDYFRSGHTGIALSFFLTEDEICNLPEQEALDRATARMMLLPPEQKSRLRDAILGSGLQA